MRKKKIGFVAIILVLLISMAGCTSNDDASSSAQNNEILSSSGSENIEADTIDSADDFTYSVSSLGSGEKYIVINGLKMNNPANRSIVKVPESIDGMPVRVIGESAFEGYDNILSVTLPASLYKIDKEAFSGCKLLSGIIIPKQVTNIDTLAFYGCQSLIDVKIEAESLFNVSSDAFDDTPLYDSSKTGPYYIDSIFYKYNFGTSEEDIVSEMEKLSKDGFEIKDGTKTIAHMAMGYPANSLEDIVSLPKIDIFVPDSVTFMGPWSFYELNIGKFDTSVNFLKYDPSGFIYDSYVDVLDFRGDLNEEDMITVYSMDSIITDKLVVPMCECFFGFDVKAKTIILSDGTHGLDLSLNYESESDVVLEKIYIPGTVENIVSDEIITCGGKEFCDFTIYTQSGSLAEEYAKKHKINCVIVKDSSEVT